MVSEVAVHIVMCMVVYKTTNLVNGKIYIGKDSCNDPLYLGSGLILQRAIQKHGIVNFHKDILEVCSTQQDLNKREQHWIKHLNSTDRRVGYNIAKGGLGGDTFTNQTSDKKQKIVAKRDATRPRWMTVDYKEKMKRSSIALWKNDNHRDHITKLMTGRVITWADKISHSIAEWHKTNPLTDEGRKKMSHAGKKAKGREIKSISDEAKQMIIEMYQMHGPKTIANHLREKGILISPYLIVRTLTAVGIYQKWQKGVGKHST